MAVGTAESVTLETKQFHDFVSVYFHQRHVRVARLDVDRIRSAVTRLTSNSIEGLEGLSTELQVLQRFLKSEVERVQGEIESALAGIKIIVDTIAPWKNTNPAGARGIRGPAGHIEGAQPRR